jgi:hypothetical protein
MGEEGYSIVEMCAAIKCARSTLEKEWPAANPEFSEALTHARLASQSWWERKGRDCLIMAPGQGTFQASVWSRSMAARFPEDWREKSEVKHEGGLTIQVSPTENDL